MKHRGGILCVFVLLLAVGCGPYLKKDPSLSASSPKDGLLTTAVLDADYCHPSEKRLKKHLTQWASVCPGTGIAEVIQFEHVEQFGPRMIQRAAGFLRDQGVVLYTDAERARILDGPALGFVREISEAVAATKKKGGRIRYTGRWVSPDGAFHRVFARNNARVLTKDGFKRRPGILVQHLEPEREELFVFIDTRVVNKQYWLLFRRPRVEVDISVYNAEGDAVLRSRTRGFGKSGFLFVNKKASNMELAMTRALDALSEKAGEIDARNTAVAANTATSSEPEGAPPTTEGTPPVAEGAETPTPDDTAGQDTTSEVEPAQNFNPNAPPPRSLADRTNAQPEPADPSSAPPRSLADSPGREPAPEPEPEPVAAKKKSGRAPQPEAAKHRVGGGILLGLGGELTLQLSAEQRDLAPDDFELPKAKLETSTGGMLQYEFVPSPYFSVGARGEYFSWITEANAFGEDNENTRHIVLNLSPMVRGRVPIRSSVVYVAGKIGPSVTFPSNTVDDGNANPRLSYNYGLLGGVEIFGNSKAPSIFLEAGYMAQQVRYGVELDEGVDNPLGLLDDKVRLRLWQVGFNIGATYGF